MHFLRVVSAWCLGAVALVAVLQPDVAAAASSSTVVSATIPSATSLDASGCAKGSPSLTFGTVLTGSSRVTATDCVAEFGSSNDTSMLRAYRGHGASSAMALHAWTAQASNTTNWLEEVDPVDANVAWTVANGGVIRRTTDGGTNWATIPAGTTVNLRGVRAWDSLRAVVTGYGGTIRTTEDGGTSWAAPASGTTQKLQSVDILAPGGTGWAVGGGGAVTKTADGGASWSLQAPVVSDELRAVDLVDATTAWAVGWGGAIMKTTDGTTWTQQLNGAARWTANNLGDVGALDAATAWAVGASGTVLKTTDGGASWQTVGNVPTTASLIGVSVLDANTVWIVGSSGLVLHTADAGATWTIQSSGTANSLSRVAALNDNLAWAVGQNGTILKLPTTPIADYAAASADWATGANTFGVCLRAVGAGTTANWPVDTSCPTTDGSYWRAMPTSAASPDARVATAAASTTTARVSLRFGFRAAAAQAPGTYMAPMVFDVVAPAV